MKKFSSFIAEEVMPTAFLHDSSIDIEKDAVRQEINGILAHTTTMPCVTPYAALRRVSKALAYFHIFLPKRSYMEGDRGVEVYEVKQFGDRMGMNDQGEFITHVPAKFHLVFRYRLMGASFYVSAKIVDSEGLDKELDQAEAMVSEARKIKKSSSTSPPWNGPDRIATDNHMARVRKLAQNAMMRMSNRSKMKPVVKEGILDTIKNANPFNKAADAMSVGKAEAKPDMRIMTPAKKETTPKDGSSNSAFPANEESLNELEYNTIKRYKKAAEKDKKNALSSAETSHAHRKNRALPLEKRNAFHDEEKWLKGIAKKREKGIAMADKRLDELSKGTLGSYIKKSSQNAVDTQRKIGKHIANDKIMNRDPDYLNLTRQRRNRFTGIHRATNKLTKEETINEISHKLALRAMKKSEKRADDEWEADYAHDRLSDWKTHDTRAHRLRGHMRRKFGNKKIKTDGEDRLGDQGGDGRLGVYSVNTHGKRAGLPPKEQVNRLKNNIKFSLGKHHKPNLPEETQIDELHGKGGLEKIVDKHTKTAKDMGMGYATSSRGALAHSTLRGKHEAKAERGKRLIKWRDSDRITRKNNKRNALVYSNNSEMRDKAIRRQVNEVSADLVGKVSNARFKQGKAPSKTLTRAINKKFIASLDPVTNSERQAPKEKMKNLKKK